MFMGMRGSVRRLLIRCLKLRSRCGVVSKYADTTVVWSCDHALSSSASMRILRHPSSACAVEFGSGAVRRAAGARQANSVPGAVMGTAVFQPVRGDWTKVFYDAGWMVLALVLGLSMVCFVWIDVVLSGSAITRCRCQQVCGYYDTPVPRAQWSLEVEQFEGPLEPARQTQSPAPSCVRPRFSLHIEGVRLQSDSATRVGKVEPYGVFMRVRQRIGGVRLHFGSATRVGRVESYGVFMGVRQCGVFRYFVWSCDHALSSSARGDWTKVPYDAGLALLELLLGLNMVCFVWIDVLCCGVFRYAAWSCDHALSSSGSMRILRYRVPDAQWSLEVEQFAGPLGPANKLGPWRRHRWCRVSAECEEALVGFCEHVDRRLNEGPPGRQLAAGPLLRLNVVCFLWTDVLSVGGEAHEKRSAAVWRCRMRGYGGTTWSVDACCVDVACFDALSGAAITRYRHQEVCGYYATPVADAQWSLEVEQFAAPV
ncbi:hypothetical protein EBH_0060290 [Eimeria brunetti]|uniref:Transmembrane protein n=1 Tax=Eimeria brunetti TaxID=51314 RepID=U6LZ91_9EIME|nr:hypothetical protein EBH_0060290 [Eimeria brunetti]